MEPGRCQVWVASPDVFAPYDRELDALLSPSERDRVRRHRVERDVRLARLSRAVLRLVVAQCLGVQPQVVDVDRRCPECGEPHGPPRVRGPRTVQVSVAHCADLLVLAVHPSTPIGVDVESRRDRLGEPAAELLDLALTPPERRRVAGAPPGDRWPLFLRYWTGKEAVLKRLRAGLSVPLRAVCIPDPEAGGRVSVSIPGPPGELWVRPVDVGDGHVAAIATDRAAAVGPVTEVPVTWLTGHR